MKMNYLFELSIDFYIFEFRISGKIRVIFKKKCITQVIISNNNKYSIIITAVNKT